MAGALEEKVVDLKGRREDKRERHNEKKARKRRGGEKDGDRRERKTKGKETVNKKIKKK